MGIEVMDLTPEMRAKLNRFMPIPISSTFEYVPVAFRELPDGQRPVFTLKYLDGTALMRSMDMLYGRVVGGGDDNISLNVNRGAFVIYVCEHGIAGWRDYFGVEYKDRTSIGRLPPDLLNELCNAITERRGLADEEKLGLR